MGRVVSSAALSILDTVLFAANASAGPERPVPSGVYCLRLAVPGGAELFDTIHVVRQDAWRASRLDFTRRAYAEGLATCERCPRALLPSATSER